MFSIGSESRVEAAKEAVHQLQLWENALSLRISLQTAMDTSARLPLRNNEDSDDENDENRMKVDETNAKEALLKLYNILQISSGNPNNTTNNENLEWEDIEQLNSELTENWKGVVNKWHSRLQLGSKDAISKMKTFKQTFWDQIDIALADEKRVIEKSRISWQESPRMNKNEIENENSMQVQKYDEEVYDDRQFYSLLLKTFINQSSTNVSNLQKDDLEAIRKFKKSKSKVDRKASKGRKIRYTVHPKLQNFLYPIPPPPSDIDVSKLMQSLFQS